MIVSLSIVIATMGRLTLEQTLDSLLPQLADQDEVVVVVDRRFVRDLDGMRQYFDPSWRCRWFKMIGRDTAGDAQRAYGIDHASGSHLAFIDDDDVYLPGALDQMRDHACDRPVIFRMNHHLLGVLWRVPEVAYGNVGTPMFLVPNTPAKLGRWDQPPAVDPRAADSGFIAGCVAKMGEPVWREEVTVLVRPDAPERNH